MLSECDLIIQGIFFQLKMTILIEKKSKITLFTPKYEHIQSLSYMS